MKVLRSSPRTKKAAVIALRRLIHSGNEADQTPSEAGSILKPGPIVDDRLMRFT